MIRDPREKEFCTHSMGIDDIWANIHHIGGNV